MAGDARAALVFGAGGAIGATIAARLRCDGLHVVGTSRTGDGESLIAADPFGPGGLSSLDGVPQLDVVVWAQGTNVNDRADGFDQTALIRILEANTLFVTATLHELVDHGRIADGARLCVVSSVWQEVARAGKFSYTVSKAALGGFVRAAALDLGPRGILVNAVLPGVVDTPMTRSMLTAEQIAHFRNATTTGDLVSAEGVASAVAYLCSLDNTAVTGQSLLVDLGFSHGRTV